MSVTLDGGADGSVLTLTVDSPPGNVLDIATCSALSGLLEEAAGQSAARLLVVRGAGKHFSFGASVEEHLPEQAETIKRLRLRGRAPPSQRSTRRSSASCVMS